MMKFKLLASMMIASLVALSSASLAHGHKRTHHPRSFNSMDMTKKPVEPQPGRRSSPVPSSASEGDASKFGGGAM
jgi:hypothetical protein